MRRGIVVLLLVVAGVLNAEANLLMNPSFETVVDAKNWTTTWGTFGRENWNNPPNGSHAAYLKGSWAGTDNGGIIQSLPGKPNMDYNLSAHFYFDNEWTASSKLMKIEFFDGQDVLLDSVVEDIDGLAQGKWIQKTLRARSPSGTARVQVVFEASGIGTEGVFGIDACSLTALPAN